MSGVTYRLPDWLGGHEVLNLVRNGQRTTARVAHPLGGWHEITVDSALLIEVPPPGPAEQEHAPRRDPIGRLRCKCGWPSFDVAPSMVAFEDHVEVCANAVEAGEQS